ncbi:hypothetical protein AVEN_143093-1 [Araneus ventricosus]|uniref:Uncharacterized protein n=1 Tax=Araneus ventricosus TaxID=182803 RepID=A0A4Y2I6S6_ARAVE|nr:hypothetical protein AVEN_143093-1 [Araneus ventricosus]
MVPFFLNQKWGRATDGKNRILGRNAKRAKNIDSPPLPTGEPIPETSLALARYPVHVSSPGRYQNEESGPTRHIVFPDRYAEQMGKNRTTKASLKILKRATRQCEHFSSLCQSDRN